MTFSCVGAFALGLCCQEGCPPLPSVFYLCFVFLVFMHLSRSIWEMFCMYKQTSASNIESYVYFEAEIKGLKDRISECLHFLVKAVIRPCLPQHVFVFFLDALSGQNLLLLAICLFDFLHCMYTTIPVCFGWKLVNAYVENLMFDTHTSACFWNSGKIK